MNAAETEQNIMDANWWLKDSVNRYFASTDYLLEWFIEVQRMRVERLTQGPWSIIATDYVNIYAEVGDVYEHVLI